MQQETEQNKTTVIPAEMKNRNDISPKRRPVSIDKSNKNKEKQ